MSPNLAQSAWLISAWAVLAGALGCAHDPAASRATAAAAPSAVVTSTTQGPGAGELVTTEIFTVVLPAGYEDATAMLDLPPRFELVLRAKTSASDPPPTIVVQAAPIPGGTFADAAACATTGRGVIAGGTVSPGTGGALVAAAIVDGPLGKTCQIQLRAAQGMALITELIEPGNTELTPKPVHLMTCNYADGDAAAEATCRSTLATFRLRGR